jgi:hypothetical protein
MRESYGFTIFIATNLVWYPTPLSTQTTFEPETEHAVQALASRFARRFSESARLRTGATSVEVETLFARKASAHLGQLAKFSFVTFDEWELWRGRFETLPHAMNDWVENEWEAEVGPGISIEVTIEPQMQTLTNHARPTQHASAGDDERLRPAGTDHSIASEPKSKSRLRSNLNAMLSFAAFCGLVVGAALMFAVATALQLDSENKELATRLNGYEQRLTSMSAPAPACTCNHQCVHHHRRP